MKFLVELRLFILSRRLDPLPIRELAGNYPVGLLRSDIRAGLNVALLAFPQGLAYAAIADLPIVYGVTGSAIAAIVAPLFIGSRFTILGPTNATSFMIFSFFAAYRGLDAERWITLVILMAGIALIAGAFLRLADLMQYVSRSVVVGYVTGAALLSSPIRRVMFWVSTLRNWMKCRRVFRGLFGARPNCFPIWTWLQPVSGAGCWWRICCLRSVSVSFPCSPFC